MSELYLWFQSLETCQLSRTRFASPSHPKSILSIRGKTPLYTNSRVTATFQWTSAVHAMCIMLVQASLHMMQRKLNSDEFPFLFSGGQESPAASLDYALSKEPAWLVEMFGFDAGGRAIATKLFRRFNPGRKANRPVEISINEKILGSDYIRIFLDGQQLRSPDALSALATTLECAWPYRPSDILKAPEKNLSLPSRIDCMDEVQRNFARPVLTICDSDLVVVKSVLIAWDLESQLRAKGFDCVHVISNWSDNILSAVEKGEVSLAVYNTARTTAFIKSNECKNIGVLGSLGHSMGGKNFYILAKERTKWMHFKALDQFRRVIRREGATIAVPSDCDMFDNFLTVMGLTEEDLANSKIKLVKIRTSQGLEAFELHPELLLIHGQNVRFQAEFRGGYLEVLGFDDLPADAKERLRANSRNSVVYDKRINQYISEVEMQRIFDQAVRAFYGAWLSPDRFPQLLDSLIGFEQKHGFENNQEMSCVIRNILFETYRLGEPC